MEIRDIIVWLGLVAIVVIIWDGLRRMKKVTKPKKVVDEHYVDPEEEAKKAQLARELPNGGARVVGTMSSEEQRKLKTKLNLRERVPMLMERVDVKADEDEKQDEKVADHLQSELDFSAAMADWNEGDESNRANATHEPEVADADLTEANEPTDLPENEQPVEVDEVSEPASLDAHAHVEESREVEPEYEASAAHRAESVEPEPEPEPKPDSSSESLGPVEDLVIVHVMAPNEGELSGSLVLDLLVTAGLRHGPMDIFHYRNPHGVTEFSLANCIQPGTFNPDSMNQVNTPGVTLFMQLPTAADALESFDHMIEMAQFLAKHLEATILDEDHSTVTPQRIEYYREKIRSFVRTKLISS